MEQLNDDCLIHVFSFLTIIDRLQVQRVCKRWRSVSHISFQSIKYLRFTPELWGIGRNSSITINRSSFQQVVGMCGSSLLGVDIRTDRIFHVQACKKTFSIVHELCPKIEYISIKFSGKESEAQYTSTIQFIADHFQSLTYFKIQNLLRRCAEDSLSLLFSNNPNLKHYEMINGYLLKEVDLSKLNFPVLQELHLDQLLIKKATHLVEVLKELSSLHTLRFTSCIIKDRGYMNSFLEALSLISRSLENLYLQFTYNNIFDEIQDYSHFSALKNLKKLSLTDKLLVNDEVLAIIGANCKKLTELQLCWSDVVTDDGILKICELPHLERLHMNWLQEVTDQALFCMPSLRRLECCRCPMLRSQGLLEIMQSSAHIESIKLNCCKSISVHHLIDGAVNCRRDNFELIIDSSEIENDLIQCVYTVHKNKNLAVKTIKTICFECIKNPPEDNSADNGVFCDKCRDIKEVL